MCYYYPNFQQSLIDPLQPCVLVECKGHGSKESSDLLYMNSTCACFSLGPTELQTSYIKREQFLEVQVVIDPEIDM